MYHRYSITKVSGSDSLSNRNVTIPEKCIFTQNHLMKTLFILLLLPLSISAQDMYYGDNNYWLLSSSMRQASGKRMSQVDFYFVPDFAPEKYGISSVTVNVQKPKYELTRTSVYNSQGLLTSYRFNDNVTDYVYNDTLLLETTYQWKKHTSRTIHTYSGDKRIMTQDFRDGKLVQELTFMYDGEHCIKSTCVEYDHRRRVSTLEHTVDPLTGKVVKATYFVNGKLKKKWDYSCNDKGVATDAKIEAVSSYCTYNQENNDGSYSTFARSIREGKVYLTQTDFNADSTRIRTVEYLNDSIVVRKTDFIGKRVVTAVYNPKKSKLDYTVEYETNDQNHMVMQKFTDNKGKIIYMHEYAYLENGLVASITETDSKARKRTSSYNYTFF